MNKFKVGDVVVVSEEHKKVVKKDKANYRPWWVESLEDEFVVRRVWDYGAVEVDAPRNISTGKASLDADILVLKVDKTVEQLQQENEQLKQRLIEAERNALYWTAFDCPVNRDIAERILRKGN